MKCEKSGNHTISYQSLLLSTTVLNDTFICFSYVVIKMYEGKSPNTQAKDHKQPIQEEL